MELISEIFKGLEGVKVLESYQISYKISDRQVKKTHNVTVAGSVGMHQVEMYEKAKRDTCLVGAAVNIEIDVKVEIDVGSPFIPMHDVHQLSNDHK